MNKQLGQLSLWGRPPKGSASPSFRQRGLPRSGTTFFASFSRKRRTTLNVRMNKQLGQLSLWGTPPNPQGRLRRELGNVIFREAEQRFLLLFRKRRISLGYKCFPCTYEQKFRPIDPLRALPKPRGSASQRFAWAVWSSAKRNNAFCFFFWKKKNSVILLTLTSDVGTNN
jgi:hypothetical protein